jgi:hypothetical protein
MACRCPRVRRDDPVAYLRTVAMLVRPVQPAEVEEDPIRNLSNEELRAKMICPHRVGERRAKAEARSPPPSQPRNQGHRPPVVAANSPFGKPFH